MAEGKSLARSSDSAGDAAVDGLFGGLAAGILMAVFLILVGLTNGIGPGITMGHFGSTAGVSPLVGSVLHLAVSGVYGLIFGMLYRIVATRVPGWLAGTVFGLILFSVARGLLLPATDSALMDIPFWQFGAAHMLYGLALGLAINKRGG